MKIKIGTKTYELNGWSAGSQNGRPTQILDIKEKYSVIKPLIIDGQTYILTRETIEGEEENIDLTSSCKYFVSILERANNTCVLTMSTDSELEKKQQDIDDLSDIVEALSE